MRRDGRGNELTQDRLYTFMAGTFEAHRVTGDLYCDVKRAPHGVPIRVNKVSLCRSSLRANMARPTRAVGKPRGQVPPEGQSRTIVPGWRIASSVERACS